LTVAANALTARSASSLNSRRPSRKVPGAKNYGNGN